METKPDPYVVYEITVEGHLDERWSDWFDNLSISYPTAAITLLRGNLADQAALFGILKKIHNLGLLLISVQREVFIRGDRGNNE